MATTSEIPRLLEQFDRAFAGDAWHGPPLQDLLGDVDATLAADRPIPGAHTIRELVTHVTYWLDAARRRLAGEVVSPQAGEDWPPTPAPTPPAWAIALTEFRRAGEGLTRAIRSLHPDDLQAAVPGEDYFGLCILHGVLQHTLYHAGQIALLKRAARAAPNPEARQSAGA